MTSFNLTILEGPVVEEEVQLSLAELCRACRVREDVVQVWVVEGVLEPHGERPQDWRFAGPALRRARLAASLARDLEVNSAGVALALDLFDRIDALETRLKQVEGRGPRG